MKQNVSSYDLAKNKSQKNKNKNLSFYRGKNLPSKSTIFHKKAFWIRIQVHLHL